MFVLLVSTICFVGEVGGKNICIEGSRKGEVIEILRDTWHHPMYPIHIGYPTL
jgi:hypothetical protein